MGKGSKELREKALEAARVVERWEETVSSKNPHGSAVILAKFINYFRDNDLSWNKIGLASKKDSMISAKEYFLTHNVLSEKFTQKNKHKTIFIKEREHVS